MEENEVEARAREWDEAFDREEGPFDIAEVDLEADEDEVNRIDLGSLVVTPFEGMTMQLQVNRDNEQVQSILVGDGASGLEVAVFAARPSRPWRPRSARRSSRPPSSRRARSRS
ncbi:DUF3710 domain-containing protein [Tessaracoccus sp. HDW20]|nr:DUF3710 domain-containing protein [Tessaracoccus coleopterorum]